MGKKYAIYMIHDGEQIGPFSKREIGEMIDAGKVSRSDLAWHDKLQDWEPLDGMIPLTRAEEERKWDAEPASDAQKNYLRNGFGIEPPDEITSRQASALIDKCLHDPMFVSPKQAEIIKQEEERPLYPSFYLKRDISAAKEELELAKRDNDEFIDDYRNELNRLKTARVDFWRATMHKYGVSCNDEDDLYEFSDAIDSLARDYGYLFKEQSAKRISAILDMLDSAVSDWDKTEPHTFYCELKEKFPDSLKDNSVEPTSNVFIDTKEYPKKQPEESQVSAMWTAFKTTAVIFALVVAIIFIAKQIL